MKQMNASKTKRTQGWKIIFPLLAIFLCLSCNKDDDEPAAPTIPTIPNFVKMTIGGTQYTFDHFVVETQTVTEPDFSYVDLKVIGTMANDDTKEIIFNLEQDVTGSETIYYFYFRDNEVEYEYDAEVPNPAFATNVDINANRRIIGTFSGTLSNFDNTANVAVQNGSFDVTY